MCVCVGGGADSTTTDQRTCAGGRVQTVTVGYPSLTYDTLKKSPLTFQGQAAGSLSLDIRAGFR